MNTKLTSIVVGVAFTLATSLAQAGTTTTATNFSASDSLFGLSAGFDFSGSSPGPVGVSYRAFANTGTVNSNVNGSLRATFDDVISVGDTANVVLDYLGGLSSLSSSFGMGASVSAFVNVSIDLPFPVPDFNVNETVEILNLIPGGGLELSPSSNFVSNLGAGNSASDSDTGIAAVVPIIPIPIVDDVGAGVNLDLRQTINLTPTAVEGILRGVNRNNGNTIVRNMNITGPSDTNNLLLAGLDTGIWDFSLLDIDLFNLFRNDVDLDINPTITLPLLPDPTFNLATVNLFDQTFALDFNTLNRQNLFSILVTPIPAAVWLFGTALLGFVGFARRRTVA